MDPLLRQIVVALGSSAIVWAIWFFIAKEKNNHKQMVYATVFCCFVFFTMAFSPLAGAAFWGAYALINYVKKMGDTPTQAPQEPVQMEITLPEEKKEENPHRQRWKQYETNTNQTDDTPPKLTKIDKILFFGLIGIYVVGITIALIKLFIESL